MSAKSETRFHPLALAAAAVALCGCVTLPTPESIEQEFKEESKARSMETLSTGSNAERMKQAKNLKYDGNLAIDEKVSALRTALQDPNGAVRSNAAGSLHHLGEEAAARAAIPELRANLADPHAGAALNAITALNRMDEAPDTLLLAARTVSQRADLEMEDRVFAAAVMDSLGAEADEVAPALVEGLRSERNATRKRAYNTLREMGKLPGNTIPHFVEALEAEDIGTVKFAALLLSQAFRPPPKEVLPAATAALARGNGDLNEKLLTLLISAGAEAGDAVPAVTALLQQQPLVTRNERVKGVTALGSIGIESDEVVDCLLHLATTDPDAQIRQVTLMTASRFTENTARIRAFLEQQAKDGATEEERNQAAGNLRMMDAMQQMKTQP